MGKRILLTAMLVLSLCSTLSAYQNPISLPKEAEGPGVADPGLLRWMGKYYLYATKTGEQGIRCWESADLVHWKFKAYVTGDEPEFADHMAWSPGPFYYNGRFYLYICGVDQKHKVFEADKPWGPFKCVNRDLIDVNTLDAVPFLDDDGQLYFFYAGWGGNAIQWRKASSPVKADGPNQKLPACQFSVNPDNWWTEGPALFKRDGMYYLTYCGNNWVEDNYQIRAAKGRSIEQLKPQSEEPFIAQLTGTWRATGCNWMIIGPDLKSLWNVYHCRKGGSWERRLCLDRLYIDPKTKDLWADGPTWDWRANPALPTWYENFSEKGISANWQPVSGRWEIGDGEVTGSGELLCKVATKESFAAEFNVRLAGGSGSYGVVLCDKDGNRLLLTIEAKSKNLVLSRVDGKRIAKVASALLPKDFDLKVWHTIRVEKQSGRLRIYFDEMLKMDKQVNTGGGRFGFTATGCKASFGWCGFSNIGEDDGIERAQAKKAG